MQPAHQMKSIFDVANQVDSLVGCNSAAFSRIFRVTSAQAKCHVGPELASKYKVQQQNAQNVVSVTNMYSFEQTWFNQDRRSKPQTFKSIGSANLDTTNNGANCDFCAWQKLTAEDVGFSRIQLPHTVTASNLFKCAEPSHGVVMFRHHQPHVFSQPALSDLMDAAWLWFLESKRRNPHAAHPFLLWNCLARAGASQYHGHAQVMLSSVPVPAVEKMQRAAASYQQQHPDCCYYTDLLKAHAAVGLLRQVTCSQPASTLSCQQLSHTSQHGPNQQQQQHHTAWGFASVAPWKDMEVTVVGRHLCCPAFQRMLHAALRALLDGFGAATFNVGVLNLDLSQAEPAGVGLSRQFWSSNGPGLEVRDLTLTQQQQQDQDVSSDGSGLASTTQELMHSRRGHVVYCGVDGSSRSMKHDEDVWLPDHDFWCGRPPIVARLASRGRPGAAASDFGALEVWGGASIGHTDPFAVIQHLEAQLYAGDSTDEAGLAGVHTCSIQN